MIAKPCRVRVAVLCVLAFLSSPGCGQNETGPKRHASPPIVPPVKEPDWSLTTVQFAEQFRDDSKASAAKYRDLGGEIVAKETNAGDAVSIELKGDGKTKILCVFPSVMQDIAEPLKVGQKAKILGEFTLNIGKGDVKLYSCLLLDAAN